MKRITLFAGHYGSGKTNIAVNYAVHLKDKGLPVIIADLDIVNPYFRTKDSEELLKQKGIELISPEFANSNVDLPALPQEMYKTVQDKESYVVMDIGGDDRGAYALGRYTPSILEENNFEMLFVANFYRPLTTTPNEALEVMREIEVAGGLPFTGIVNNSNIGDETTPEDVIATLKKTNELSKLSNLPIVFTTANRNVAEKLTDKISDVFSLDLQSKLF
jgi:signal recognition particle receptor subunit beta